ncbi:centrosomal protein, partial [Planoprotostelium fungivorum]
YNQLSEKYKSLLESEKETSSRLASLEPQRKAEEGLKEKIEQLEVLLTEARNKCTAFDKLASKSASTEDLNVKIAALEVSEFNARSKAELAVRKLNRQKQNAEDLQVRMNELETKLSLVNRERQIALESESELRHRLEGAVTTAEASENVNRIISFEERHHMDQAEIVRLKELIQLSGKQNSGLNEKILRQNRELDKTREALGDLGSQSDMQLAFAKNQQLLMATAMNEAMCQHKFDELNKQYQSLHGSYRKMEKVLEQRLDLIFKIREDHRVRVDGLQGRIDELLRGDRYTERTERLVMAMKVTEENNWNMERDRAKLRANNEALEGQLMEAKAKIEHLELIKKSLPQDPSTKAFIEAAEDALHRKTLEIRLRRENAILEQEKDHYVKMYDGLKSTVEQLELQLDERERLAREANRDTDKRLKAAEEAMHKKERDSDLAILLQHRRILDENDPNYPVAVRLEEAYQEMEEKEKMIGQLKGRVDELTKQNDVCREEIRRLQELIATREAAMKTFRGGLTDDDHVLLMGEVHDKYKAEALEDRTKLLLLQNRAEAAEAQLEKMKKKLETREKAITLTQDCHKQMRDEYEKQLEAAKKRVLELNEEHFKERERFIEQLQKSIAIAPPTRIESAEPTMSLKEVDGLLLSKESQIHQANLSLNEARKTQLALHDRILELERHIDDNKGNKEMASQMEDMMSSLEQVHSQFVESQGRCNQLQMELKHRESEAARLRQEKAEVEASKTSEIRQLQSHLQSERERLNQTKTSSAATVVSPAKQPSVLQVTAKYKAQLANKDKKISALQDAVVSLKKELVSAYERVADNVQKSGREDSSSDHRLVTEISSLQNKLLTAEETIAKLKANAPKTTTLSQETSKEKEHFEQLLRRQDVDLKKSHKTIRELQIKVTSLEGEVEIFKSKEVSNPSIEELEKKLRVMQQQAGKTKSAWS